MNDRRSLVFSTLIVLILLTISTKLFSDNSKSTDKNAILILDLSRSMWGKIDETSKVVIARRAIRQMLDEWDKNTKLGVMVYGSRHRNSCKDIQTLSEVRRVDRRRIMKMLARIRPVGRTPLTASVKLAASKLKSKNAAATIILVSDGIDNCGLNSCKVAKMLKQENKRLRVHVVGLGVKGIKGLSKLKCIASNTGGKYYSANSASKLRTILKSVNKIVSKQNYRRSAPKVEDHGSEVSVRNARLIEQKSNDKKPKSNYMYEKTYSFSVVPQQSAEKTEKIWGPILNRVSKQSGIKLVLKTSKTIPEFEKELKIGWYDFSYMNPFHYTVFHDTSNYHAIIKPKDKKIKGIIVVRKNSSIKSVKDLQGGHLAFPSPSALGATILTRAYLEKQGINIRPNYVSSHDLVYRSVSSKKYRAGGGAVRTIDKLDKDVSDTLRVLWTTKGYTPHAIAVHKRVPKEIVDLVQKSFADLHKSEMGRKLLRAVKLQGFVNAKNSDWDDVRALKIDPLKVTESY